MKIFLLIVISLIFGFSAGFRFKRRKLVKTVAELKQEIKEKETQIEMMKRHNHLLQYTNNPKHKFDQENFEQEITKYATLGEEEFIDCSILKQIVETLNYPYEEIVSLSRIQETIEMYIAKKNFEKKEPTIKVLNSLHSMNEIPLDMALKRIQHLLSEVIGIINYHITYKQMLDSLDFVLSQNWE